MLCAKPWRNAGSELPCGQCMPCRINRRNIWTTRLLLELTQHDEASWITLTYNNNNLPYNEELSKDDYQLWLKRLRKANPEKKIRYYLCGEYGDNSGRPHFHVVLFGLGFNFRGLAEYDQRDQLNRYPRPVVKMLNVWGKGNIHFETPTQALLTYACGHITKSLADKDSAEEGRTPEFHAMSRGLGKGAMSAIVSWLSTEEGVKHYHKSHDVPSVVRIDKKLRPIGKYLRNIIRRELGLEERQTDEAIYLRGLQELEQRCIKGEDYKQSIRLRHDQVAKQTVSLNRQRRHL